MRRRGSDGQNWTVIVTGHRGARAEAPENTLDGFAHAAAIGLESVEFDVRMSADGQLMVMHDASVDRTTDGTGSVAELTAAALAALDAAARFPGWERRCAVPTLSEVLDATVDFDQFEIEIKRDPFGRTDQVVDQTLAELARAGRREAAVLTSFHPEALARAALMAPDVRRGLIGDWADPAMCAQALALGAGRACIHLTTSSPEICAAARQAGLQLIGWPCEDEADWDRCLAWGLDGFTTDHPSRVRKLTHGSAS